MTQCAKGWNALGSQCVPKRGPLCGFNIVGFEFECARLVCGVRYRYQCQPYNGTASAICVWGSSSQCSQCSQSGYMAGGKSSRETRARESGKTKLRKTTLVREFTSNRISRQKRKNQFPTKINIFFPLILRISPATRSAAACYPSD